MITFGFAPRSLLPVLSATVIYTRLSSSLLSRCGSGLFSSCTRAQTVWPHQTGPTLESVPIQQSNQIAQICSFQNLTGTSWPNRFFFPPDVATGSDSWVASAAQISRDATAADILEDKCFILEEQKKKTATVKDFSLREAASLKILGLTQRSPILALLSSTVFRCTLGEPIHNGQWKMCRLHQTGLSCPSYDWLSAVIDFLPLQVEFTDSKSWPGYFN